MTAKRHQLGESPGVKQLVLFLPRDVLTSLDEHRALGPVIVAAYQALWHPGLLAGAEGLPVVQDFSDVPQDPDSLIAIPSQCMGRIPDLVRKDLDALHATILPADSTHTGIDGPSRLLHSLNLPSPDAELLLDFYALGFAHLGLEVFFEQMGHDSSVDPWSLWDTVRQATTHCLAGENDAAHERLQLAFDLLLSHRQSAFPGTIHLVDLAFLPWDATSEALARPTRWKAPVNLIVSGAELDAVARRNPELVVALRSALETGNIEVVGGAYDDRPWALLPMESRHWQLDCSAAAFQEHLGRPVECFASRSMSLSPDLPQLLMKHQFRYALHTSFDGARVPQFVEPKLHWTSPDGSVIEAMARTARDAGVEADALRVFAALAKTAGGDRSATLVLAHWLQPTATWHHWLLRVAQYAEVFGKFQSFSDYFLNSSFPDRPTHTRSEEYCTNTLAVSVQRSEPDPISRWTAFHERRGRFDALRAAAGLARLAAGSDEWDLIDLEDAVENGLADADQRLAAIEPTIMDAIAKLALADAEPNPGWLVFNPCSFARRVRVELQGPVSSAPERPVVAVQADGERTRVVLDVPGWGFAWLASGAADGVRPSSAPMAKVRRLRNDFLEVEIDAKTGGIRGIWPVRTGYSRLGQQLVHSAGSMMVSHRTTVSSSGPAYGEIVTEGELCSLNNKSRLAEFHQRVRLGIGKPLVEIDLHLEPTAPVSGDPSQNYFACRWAWPDEKTQVMPGNGFVLQSSHVVELEAPELIELRERNLITDIIVQGLPFHRRTGYRMADTLLIVAGETRRDFRMQIAMDMAHRWSAVFDAQWPVFVRRVTSGPPPGGRTGWLAHLSTPNVVCTQIVTGDDPATFRLRFVETSGKSTQAKLRFCRNPAAARIVNARGQLIFDLHPNGDTLQLDFAGREQLDVEVTF